MYCCISHACYMPLSSYPPSLGDSNHTWQRVQVTNFITQFSPASCRFIPIQSIHSPQQHFLKLPQSMSLPEYEGLSITPVRNHSRNCFPVYSNVCVFRQH
jgi:hypothetical protein